MAKWHFNKDTEEFHGDNLYFIQVGNTGPIKIGRAADASKRLRNLQVGNPLLLRIRAEIPNDGFTEIFWHEAFIQFRIRGEWFEPTAAICRAIDCAKKGAPWADEVPAPEGVCQFHYSQLMLDAFDIFQDHLIGGKPPGDAVRCGMSEIERNVQNLIQDCPKGGCSPEEQHRLAQEAWDKVATLPAYSRPAQSKGTDT